MRAAPPGRCPVTAVVQPRIPAGMPGGGQFAPWMFETGPLPVLDRPSATELPPPPPRPSVPVRRIANGAVLISDDTTVPNRWHVHVTRIGPGSYRVTYLTGEGS